MAKTEFVRYSDDGYVGDSIGNHYYSTSYSRNGAEIILSETFTGHPIRTAISRIIDAADFLFRPVPHTSMVDSCVANRNSIIGTEIILNHATVATRLPLGDERNRMTVWLAPDLGCFAVKVTTEKLLADGSFVLESERRTLSIEAAR